MMIPVKIKRQKRERKMKKERKTESKRYGICQRQRVTYEKKCGNWKNKEKEIKTERKKDMNRKKQKKNIFIIFFKVEQKN